VTAIWSTPAEGNLVASYANGMVDLEAPEHGHLRQRKLRLH
jgi:hypothetical protein